MINKKEKSLFVEKDVLMRDYTTLKLGGLVKYLCKIKDFRQIESVLDFSLKNKIPIFPLGGGSNIFASNIIKDILILKIENNGKEVLKENRDFSLIRVSAGENWDNFVSFSVSNKLSGVEALSFIPGTIGGTPIQNVGAYGAEVSQIIDSVRVFDFNSRKYKDFKNEDCCFSYRNSVFKKMPKGSFIIESVVFKLSKKEPKIPNYAGIPLLYEKFKIENKNLSSNEIIRKAIIETRKSKLPDPKYVPNCGSFFKNVYISEKEFLNLKEKFEDIVFFKEGGLYKIPSGFLIEKAGLKGFKFKNVGVYDKNALVLVNFNSIDSDEMNDLIKIIKEKVFSIFNLEIQTEPDFLF